MVIEEVACKSGLLLVDHDARTLLERQERPQAWIFDRPRDGFVRVRPEEVEAVIVDLRWGIGDLADDEPGMVRRIRLTQELIEQGIDPRPLYAAFAQIVESGRYAVIGREAMEEMAHLSGMPKGLVARFLMTVADDMDRSVSWTRVTHADVEWAIPLNTLFESEHVPEDPEAYLDQRYIDFLVNNSEDIERMNWRNFERLTAEFFRRSGYEIELGPGTKDGGIDVRA